MSSNVKTGQKLRKRFKKELPFHLMLLPAVVMVVLFKYIPMAGLSIAFQDYSPLYSIFEQEWCGWENFKYIFSLSTFPRVIYNTLFIAIMKIAAGIIVPVTVALLLNEVRNIVYKRTLQTIVYLPHFISWVALAGIFLDVLGMTGAPTKTMMKRWSTLLALQDETFVKIISGSLGIEAFDDFVTQWNEQGGSTIQEEITEMYMK